MNEKYQFASGKESAIDKKLVKTVGVMKVPLIYKGKHPSNVRKFFARETNYLYFSVNCSYF